MSRERFQWLEAWVADPSDIIRTPGSESNVKEIYDACAELERRDDHIIFNQFSEFGNYLVHYSCTGRALGHLFEHLRGEKHDLSLAAFVAASGSAGTLGAGDYLKEQHGARIVAAEAIECPTMLYNGFGEHNIQGIGDKHIPLIHNVMNTDLVVGVSDRATDQLHALFNSESGRDYLGSRRQVPGPIVEALSSLGLSGICNVLAAIKTARTLDLGPTDAIVTLATDSAEMYGSELTKTLHKLYPTGFDAIHAGETFGAHVMGASSEHVLELSHMDRTRIFNLGYFTWVEQQGISIEDFEARRRASFWRGLQSRLQAWDSLIQDFNGRTGVGGGGMAQDAK